MMTGMINERAGFGVTELPTACNRPPVLKPTVNAVIRPNKMNSPKNIKNAFM